MQVNCITVDCVKLNDVGSPAGSKLKFAVFYQANTIGQPSKPEFSFTVSCIQDLMFQRRIIYL